MNFDLVRSPIVAAPGCSPAHVALVGNFPPRRCGIATYTHDSWLALRTLTNAPRVDVYAMDDGQDAYGSDLTLIPEDARAAYAAAARTINASGAEIVWIQHEFGIFGGEAGGYLLDLIDRLEIPFAITLHTVLERFSGAQRSVMTKLLDRAVAVIVMAEKGRELLLGQFAVAPDKISVIPHGVPDRPLLPPETAKAKIGLPLRPTILTFGLLSPDKGIADMIEALPAIRESCPDVHYVVLGATHPHLKRREGEAYREQLMKRAAELDLGGAISFVDAFVELDALLDWLAAADVYVTPYRNPLQITSGTLSYAVGLGKPVVSTPYVHATEILADGHGVLVDFASPGSLATAIATLLNDDETRQEIAERAYARGRTMTWPSNAAMTMRAMTEALARPMLFAAPATSIQPVLRLSPVERLTDGTGMLQHSVGGVADRRHGYCIDDNARALMLMSLADDLPLDDRLRLSAIYASFVQFAWNEETGAFRNFMAFDRSWLEDSGSDDSNGRTLWALGVGAACAPTMAARRWSMDLFNRTIAVVADADSPRTLAFAMLGACAALRHERDHAGALAILERGADSLTSLLETSRRPDWTWFEIFLSYDNTRLCEALIRAGAILHRPELIETGLETLAWIARQTTGPRGDFRPVGTESFGARFAAPALFDQQPLEAWAMIDACAAAFDATGDRQWVAAAKAAHDWFLGANVAGQPLIDPLSGECHDGITPHGVNLNHGAESVLAWQFAARQFRKLADNAGEGVRRASGAIQHA